MSDHKNDAPDWTVIVQEINENCRRSDRRASLILELAVLAMAGLAVWALVCLVLGVLP